MKKIMIFFLVTVSVALPALALALPSKAEIMASVTSGANFGGTSFASRIAATSSWRSSSQSFEAAKSAFMSRLQPQNASFQAARTQLLKQHQPAKPGFVAGPIEGTLNVPFTQAQCSTFRDDILSTYGFTPEASVYIQSKVNLDISNETTPDIGGGWWAPWDMRVHLNSTQHEAAVHEFAHTWYDNLTPSYPDLPSDLVKATAQLAAMDPAQYPQYAPAIAEAQSYMDKGWTDSTSGNYAPWEIFASFASFTMGKYKEGQRQLPEFMWPFYETLFTGNLNAIPYYEEGGHR